MIWFIIIAILIFLVSTYKDDQPKTAPYVEPEPSVTPAVKEPEKLTEPAVSVSGGRRPVSTSLSGRTKL
jgi:hypothetical protein